MFNEVNLIGRLGKDPESKEVGETTLTKFSLATSKKVKDRSSGETKEHTEWHNIVTWGGLAQTCAKYLNKGSLIHIKGEIRNRSWEDDDGNKKYITEINATTMNMLGSKSQQEDSNPYSSVPDPEVDY